MKLVLTGQRRRKLAVACVAICLAAAGYAGFRYQALHGRVYRMGYADLPELFHPGPAGKPFGLAVTLMEEAAQRADIRIEWVFAPEGADAALLAEKVDLWPYLHNKDFLKPRVYFSQPYLETPP